VNGKEFLSLNREMLGDMRRGREASPVRRLIWGLGPPRFEGTVGPRWARVPLPRLIRKRPPTGRPYVILLTAHPLGQGVRLSPRKKLRRRLIALRRAPAT
jgi:hypothetical protein